MLTIDVGWSHLAGFWLGPVVLADLGARDSFVRNFSHTRNTISRRRATESDADRTNQILRALHPHHPVNVEGLRLAATGTGFFVAKGIVLTNFHVAGSCKALTVGNNSEGEELPQPFAGMSTIGYLGSDPQQPISDIRKPDRASRSSAIRNMGSCFAGRIG